MSYESVPGVSFQKVNLRPDLELRIEVVADDAEAAAAALRRVAFIVEKDADLPALVTVVIRVGNKT